MILIASNLTRHIWSASILCLAASVSIVAAQSAPAPQLPEVNQPSKAVALPSGTGTELPQLYLTASAQTRSGSSRPDRASYNFGQISTQKPAFITHLFVLRNDTKSPITVDHLQPSCGCTTASLQGKEGQPVPTRIAPGEEAQVRVTVDPSHLVAGPIQKSVLVFVKDQVAPAATLQMSGVLQPEALFAPSTLDFGRVPAGGERSLPLSVTISSQLLASGAQPRLVCSIPDLQIVPDGPAVTTPLTPGSTDTSSSVTQAYHVMLSPFAHLGRFNAKVSLVFTAPGSDRTQDFVNAVIPLTGEVIGEVSAAPGAISFGRVNAASSPVQRIILTGQALGQAQIISPNHFVNAHFLSMGPNAHEQNAGASNTTSKAVPQMRLLEVSLRPQTPDGPLDTVVVIVTAHGQHLVLPLYAQVTHP